MNKILYGKVSDNHGHSRSLLRRLCLILSGCAIVSACAAKLDPPTMEISSAEQSLEDAEQARVAEHALPELQEARTKLSAARSAVQSENMLLAKRMAEQASVDIQLASAKAELAKALAVNEDMKTNIHVLKEEMNRNTGDSQ